MTTLRCGLFADLHVRGKDLGAFDAQVWEMKKYLDANPIDVAAVAGDVWDHGMICDKHASISTVFRIAAGFFETLNCPTFLITGNHDLHGRTSQLLMLDLNKNADVTTHYPGDDAPVTCYPFRGVNFLLQSWDWTADAMKDLREWGKPPNDNPKILISHIQIHGARLNDNGQVCEAKPGVFQAPREYLEICDYNVLGDFHLRQQFKIKGVNRGGYVGAFRQTDFGEEGNPAGFLVLNIDTDAPPSTWTVEEVELNGAPTHRTFRAETGEEVEALSAKIIEAQKSGKYICRLIAPVSAVESADGKNLEDAGVRVEGMVDYTERQARRVQDVEQGILQNHHALYDLWHEETGQEGDSEREHELIDEIREAI